MTHRSDFDDPRAEAAVLQAVLLLSTVRTAAAVRFAADERRAGRDPSAQEDAAFVRTYLAGAAADLPHDLMQLRAAHIHARTMADDGVSRLVRHFDSLSTLHRVADALHTIHRRLLSLYPDVPEDVVEHARQVHHHSRTLIEAEAAIEADAVGAFLDDALVFALRLERTANGW